MKYFSAAILFVFFVVFVFISVATFSSTNLPVSATEEIRTFRASGGEEFSVRPNGEFVFLHPAVVTCESKKPFLITGKSSDLENKIVQYYVSGRYMVSGSTLIRCNFQSYDSMPVAYAVLNPKAGTVFIIGFFVFGMIVSIVSFMFLLFKILVK